MQPALSGNPQVPMAILHDVAGTGLCHTILNTQIFKSQGWGVA
jgi:hypothetical protein